MEIEVEVPALKKVPAHLELDGAEVSAQLGAKGARLVLPALPNSAAHRIVLR
jgi:hypothetical protein